jgi:hypothetical protein
MNFRSLIVHDLDQRKLLSKTAVKDVVLSMFCRDDNREIQTCENLIGGLLRQIVELPGRDLSPAVKKLYQGAKGNGSSSHAR